MITTCASGQQGHPPYGPCIARMSLCGGHAPHAGQEGNGHAVIPQRRVPLWPGTARRGQIATRRSRCSVPMLLMASCAEKQPATPSLRAHPPPPPPRSTTRHSRPSPPPNDKQRNHQRRRLPTRAPNHNHHRQINRPATRPSATASAEATRPTNSEHRPKAMTSVTKRRLL